MSILRREIFWSAFALVFALVGLSWSDRCIAQPAVQAADHNNSFGYTLSSHPSSAIVDVLSEAGQFDLAIRILTRSLNYEKADARRYIQLNNQLVLISAKQLLASNQAATQYVAIGEKISKTAGSIAAVAQSKVKNDESFPNASDIMLFLEFGKYRALSELARYLTAAKLATVGNRSLDTAAQKSISSELEALNDLQTRIENRRSELSKPTSSIPEPSWVSELNRLVNEAYLLKIDLLAMHMDQVPPENEADRVGIATSLRTEIANVSARLGSPQSDSPRLNLLRARAAASVGEIDKAIELLDRVNKSPDNSLREQSRLMMIDILLTQNTKDSINKARSALNEMLVSSSSVSPAMALAVFRHNLLNSGASAASNPVSFETPDELARSLQVSIPAAELTKQKESIGKQFGDYWRLRAEALMLHSAARSDAASAVADLDLLDAQVQQDLLAGRLAQAIERLNGIEEQASSRNDVEKAFSTARQRNRLLYTLLRNKEKELGATADTIAARFNIAEKCRDTAIKYKSHPLAHEELRQGVLIAQGATSKTDAKLNKQVLDFILQTIEPNVSIFANSKSLESLMQAVTVVLASTNNHAAVARLWEQVAISQAGTDQQAANAVLNSRRYRAIFRILDLISEGTKGQGSTEKVVEAHKAFDSDDQSIESVCRSIYWSDLAVAPLGDDAHKSSIAWLDALQRFRSDLLKSGQVGSVPDFDKSNPIGTYEQLVYNSLRQKSLAEYFLNRKVAIPSNVQLNAVKDASSTDSLVKIISTGLAGIDARSNSASSILIGNADVGVERYKAYANTHKSLENTLWFGRMLSATSHTREANNLLTKLIKSEKVGSANWLRIKADTLLAQKNSGQQANALRDFERAMQMAPEATDQWKKVVKSVLQ